VDLVQRQPRGGPLADDGVDLPRRRGGRQRGVDDHRHPVPDAHRVVALEGDADQVGGQAEPPGDLGPGREQRRDPHTAER
jgi:hypothetical protein